MHAKRVRAVVVLPTYNEKENIKALLMAIFAQQQYLKGITLSVLVIDDHSPDNTGKIVHKLQKTHKHLHLLEGKKEGLGTAYVRGFTHAIENLHADILLEMDADFSHSPSDIPRLVGGILNGYDFVIGSRYVSGGSIDKRWSWMRRMNSKWGNIAAKYIGGIKNVNDCTGGFRAIKASLIKQMDLSQFTAKGYAFQINILHKALKLGANILEVPIHFTDRIHGESKIGINDVFEFITNALLLRKPDSDQIQTFLYPFLTGISLSFVVFTLFQVGIFTPANIVTTFLILLALLLMIQGIFFLYLMLYAWEDEERFTDEKKKNAIRTQRSITALVPARYEAAVIGDTIRAIDAIDYPDALKETFIICRTDDKETIKKAQKTINEIGKKNITLLTFSSLPINKPHSLNIGLRHATKELVVIFDAEDHPSKDIYSNANEVFARKKADVVQSGVQLMNFRSSWYSFFNVLEYYFWFKSSLHFFAKMRAIPLGGNSVFFKKTKLLAIDGWDEECLTEDADIGLRLSLQGANIQVIYDENNVTQEETPHNLSNFIKQRTRWNQGFMQIFQKGEWAQLPKKRQRLLAAYILLLPELQAFFFLLIPLSVIVAFAVKVTIALALLTIIPLLILFLQLVTLNIGLFEFTRSYKMRYPFWIPVIAFVFFFPYQILLGISAVRAVTRMIAGNISWEKTLHTNAHRESSEFNPAINI